VSEPTDEEILEELERWSEEKRNAPESERRRVTRPEKYDYPIGSILGVAPTLSTLPAGTSDGGIG